MKRFLHVITTFYIAFAILAAYTAVSSNIPRCERDLGEGLHVQEAERSLYSFEPVDRYDSYEEYTITVWTSPTCTPCKRYIREEVPALLRAGFMVYIFDSETLPPPSYIKSFPTVTLSHGDELISVKNYWKARDIKKVVDSRSGLKDE